VRILHVTTRHRRGGAENNLSSTVAWELEQGHEVVVACGSENMTGELGSIVRTLVVDSLVRDPSLRDFAALIELRRLIRRGKFDLVHTHQSKAGFLGRLACVGHSVRVWHTVHMPSFGPGYGVLESRLFMLLERLAAKRTDRLIFVGVEVRTQYERAGVHARTPSVVLRSPIDVEGFGRLREARSDCHSIRARFGLDPDAPTAVTVGAADARKRQDLILRELQPYLCDGRLQLLVCGEGPRQAQLKALARSLGVTEGVVFAGHSDPHDALLAADVLAHAAVTEGVPQVIIQALAAGVPVAATEATGVGEVPLAPIAKLPRDGRGLGAAVMGLIHEPPEPIDLALLKSWRPDSVVESRASIYPSALAAEVIAG
jgi:glycosyltransferase involved in cell wall biosynthesis